MEAGLVQEVKHGDYPRYCSPCFLVHSTEDTFSAMSLVVDYGEVKKKTRNQSKGIRNMENTL